MRIEITVQKSIVKPKIGGGVEILVIISEDIIVYSSRVLTKNKMRISTGSMLRVRLYRLFVNRA